jgi:Protein of unknown function (DUF993)
MRHTVTIEEGRTLVLDDEVAAAQRRRAGPPPERPTRLCFRHVPHSLQHPGRGEEFLAHIDWDATLRIRSHLDSHGFGTAEAMDTAQRFQLGWLGAEQLITACSGLRLRHGFVAGAGTDHLQQIRGAKDLVDGTVFQARFIQERGGIPVLLPMPWLSLQQKEERDYVDVYAAIVAQLDGPLFVHWLGEMFHPGLAGYFPGDSFSKVMAHAPDKVRGCKLSLLDAGMEQRVRTELLPREQIVLTGDDFHFAGLILGGREGDGNAPPVQRWTRIGGHEVALGDFSHALLGILDAIAAPAGLALGVLARGDAATFLEWMRPCEALGRHVFSAPTQHYKSGLALLAWLDGLQANAMLLNHEETARDREYYRRCVELAAAAGVFEDAGVTAARLEVFGKA